MSIISKLTNGVTSRAAFASSFNALVNKANILYTFDATVTAASLAHLTAVAIGDTYQTRYFDSALEEGSAAIWRAVDASNLGPAGNISYRTVFGGAIAGNPSALSTLASVGIVAGDTFVVNGNTLTVMASGASGNNQINLASRLQDLLAKIVTLMSTPLGDRCTMEFYSTGKISIQSSDINNIVTTDLVLSGTIPAKIGFANQTYVFPTGICLEGVSTRWQLVAGSGSEVDIRALGNKCDGVTVASRRNFTSTIYGAAALGYVLVNQKGIRSDFVGAVRINRTYDFRRCACDLAILAGTPVTATTAAGHGDFFNEAAHIQYLADIATWQAAGSNPDTKPSDPNNGITVYSYTDFAGTTRYAGIAVMGSGNASDALFLRQKFNIRGDGNFDFTTTSTVVAVLLSDDNSSAGEYEAEVSYCQIGVVIKDNQEKNRVKVSGQYCDLVVYADSTSSNSPDTMFVDIHAQTCKHWFWEEDGSDTSIHWNLHVESRVDPDPATASPPFWIRNGKVSILSGQMRANNGRSLGLIDKAANGAADTMVFKDFTVIHGYGTMEIRRVRHLMGSLKMKNTNDGPDSGGSVQGPALHLKRVGDAGGFRAHISGCDNREAVRIGDASTTFHANGLYGIDCDYGEYTLQMGSTIFPFNADGSEAAAGFPTTQKALVIEKMKGGSVRLAQCAGNIDVLADVVATVTGNPIVYAPRTFKRYTATKATAAVCDFICPAGDTITVTAT
ncbi:hypothetical protein EVB78_003 [Rhizobium phage RHph_N1_15]|nr:hypothetical protein EVB77_003 [Rhizobium phage RHph_N1_10]QIG69205.1 hypothetical protein EVB78_003 [Rhizobium phage RHph_N1_15]QIG75065.1 hypothetical protein EVC15_003 [Rhizobium phage RHph_N2_6]